MRFFPRSVSIDGTSYLVVEDNLTGEDGEYCAASQVIKVQQAASANYQRVVLLHELIHACFEHAGSPAEPLTEEEVCCLVSRRLLPILRDNRELVDWLTNSEGGK